MDHTHLSAWLDAQAARLKESKLDGIAFAGELIQEIGRRNSSADLTKLQTIHDHTISLGASCPTMESARTVESSDLKLTESAAPLEDIVLKEARADYPIKLIAPGKGSSAFYPAEVLQRDGPKVFTEGTHVYLNHASAAEEIGRPEGSVERLAGVLTTNAYWDESHPQGPGLYGRMKVFADHAQMLEDKAKHVGMSIRAIGTREQGKSVDGLPVLKSFVAAQSVDVVTKAGAGGMILTEGAKPSNQSEGGNDMDDAALKQLIEGAVTAAVTPLQNEVKKLREELDRPKPAESIRRHLEGIDLPNESKERVVSLLQHSVPMTEAGVIDDAKLKPLVESTAKTEAAYIEKMGYRGKTGGATGTRLTEKADEALKEEDVAKLTEAAFTKLMGDEKLGKIAATGRLI